MFTVGPSLLAPMSAAPTQFVFDNFNAANGTLISGRVGPVGCNPWYVNTAQEDYQILSNAMSGIARYGSSPLVVPTGAVSGNFYIEIGIYIQAIGSTDYISFIQQSNGSYIFTIQANTIYTEAGSGYVNNPPYNIGAINVVRAEFVGTAMTVKLNGTTLYTDTLSFAPTGIISFSPFNVLNDVSSDIANIDYILMAPLELTYYIYDNFDGATGLITGHVTNTGQTWVGGGVASIPEAGFGGDLTGAGGVVAGTDYNAVYNTQMGALVDYEIPSSTYYIELVVNVPSNAELNTFVGVIAKSQGQPTITNTYPSRVNVNWWPSSNYVNTVDAANVSGFNVAVWGNGTQTVTQVYDLPQQLGQHTLRVEITASQVKTYVDGVLKVTDNLELVNVPNPGYCGYTICQRIDTSPGVGIEILSFKVGAL